MIATKGEPLINTKREKVKGFGNDCNRAFMSKKLPQTQDLVQRTHKGEKGRQKIEGPNTNLSYEYIRPDPLRYTYPPK